MRSRFTYIADTVIEVVIDGNSVIWNVLPEAGPAPAAAPSPLPLPTEAEPAPAPATEPPSAPDLSTAQVDTAPVAAPLEMCAAAPAPTKKKRTLMGMIRAGWFVIFTAAGEALTYGLNNMTNLNLPPGTATAIGAVGYGVKKALWPSTQL